MMVTPGRPSWRSWTPAGYSGQRQIVSSCCVHGPGTDDPRAAAGPTTLPDSRQNTPIAISDAMHQASGTAAAPAAA